MLIEELLIFFKRGIWYQSCSWNLISSLFFFFFFFSSKVWQMASETLSGFSNGNLSGLRRVYISTSKQYDSIVKKGKAPKRLINIKTWLKKSKLMKGSWFTILDKEERIQCKLELIVIIWSHIFYLKGYFKRHAVMVIFSCF